MFRIEVCDKRYREFRLRFISAVHIGNHRLESYRCTGITSFFRETLLNIPENKAEEIPRFFLPFLCQKILHICREAFKTVQSKIRAVVFYKPECGYVIEMFRRSDLSRILTRNTDTIFLYKLNKAMKLARNKKCIDRVGKDNEFRLFKSLPGFGEVFFIYFDSLSDMKGCVFMIRI